jgi:hypothetical protein
MENSNVQGGTDSIIIEFDVNTEEVRKQLTMNYLNKTLVHLNDLALLTGLSDKFFAENVKQGND